MMFNVAILAGGLATRLRPLTENIPKAMVEIHGRPFIDYQLNYLKSQGIQKVVLCIGYLGHMIEEYVGNGSKYGLQVTYSYDGEIYLGTAGAIKKALALLSNDFFVLYGDSFLPISFVEVQKYFQEIQTSALMTVLKNQNIGDKSNALLKENSLVMYNKKHPSSEMIFIDYGLLIFQKSIFKDIHDSTYVDLADVLTELSTKDQLMGYEVKERFYEIGTFSGIKVLEDYFRLRKINELFSTTPE